jgi:hypothetical protein
LFFFLGYYKLGILFLLIRVSYSLEQRNILQSLYHPSGHNINADDLYRQDHDVDSSYYINLLYEEIYLIYKCRFLFEYYGGTSTLSIEDYYILGNVYDNIYGNINI